MIGVCHCILEVANMYVSYAGLMLCRVCGLPVVCPCESYRRSHGRDMSVMLGDFVKSGIFTSW